MQPTQNLRGNFKYQDVPAAERRRFRARFPGWNDSTQDDFGIYTWSSVVNYTLNNTTFIEGSLGRNTHHQEGCSIVGGDPNWCITGDPVNPIANRITAGFGDIPYLFPDATIIDPSTMSYEILNNLGSSTTVWDGTRVQAAPTFTWGTRVANAPPNNNAPFNNFILDTVSGNANLTLTKISGRHTLKAGYYYFNSVQKRGTGAIFGIDQLRATTRTTRSTRRSGSPTRRSACSARTRQLSRWGEGAYTAINHEAFIQDNWKVSRTLTLDYGMRFVHQVPNYDGYLDVSNFFPDQWTTANAPRLYVFGCDTGVYPCAAANRRAMDPATGQFVGTRGAGQRHRRHARAEHRQHRPTASVLAGKGIAKTGFTYPVHGLRAAVRRRLGRQGQPAVRRPRRRGLFFDRPPANSIYGTVNNPPFVAERHGALRLPAEHLRRAGLTTVAPPALTVFEYDNKLPSSFQWNIGMQMALPFASALDVSYTGQHSYDTQTRSNLNTSTWAWRTCRSTRIRRRRRTASTTSLVNTNVNQVRFYPGLRQHHSEPAERLADLSLDPGVVEPPAEGRPLVRLQRHDQPLRQAAVDAAAAAQRRRDDHGPRPIRRRPTSCSATTIRRRTSCAPTSSGSCRSITSDQSALKAIGYVVNDWNLAGIWSGATGAPYIGRTARTPAAATPPT